MRLFFLALLSTLGAFNWGMFWALLAAFAVRAAVRFVWGLILAAL